MNSKVLIVGSPLEGLHRTLSGDFAVQNCETPTEALPLIQAEKPLVLICCLPEETDALEFIGKACTLCPRMRVALIVPGAWSDAVAKLAESIPMLLLPGEARPAIASANLQQFVNEARKRAAHKEFVEGTARG